MGHPERVKIVGQADARFGRELETHRTQREPAPFHPDPHQLYGMQGIPRRAVGQRAREPHVEHEQPPDELGMLGRSHGGDLQRRHVFQAAKVRQHLGLLRLNRKVFVPHGDDKQQRVGRDRRVRQAEAQEVQGVQTPLGVIHVHEHRALPRQAHEVRSDDGVALLGAGKTDRSGGRLAALVVGGQNGEQRADLRAGRHAPPLEYRRQPGGDLGSVQPVGAQVAAEHVRQRGSLGARGTVLNAQRDGRPGLVGPGGEPLGEAALAHAGGAPEHDGRGVAGGVDVEEAIPKRTSLGSTAGQRHGAKVEEAQTHPQELDALVLVLGCGGGHRARAQDGRRRFGGLPDGRRARQRRPGVDPQQDPLGGGLSGVETRAEARLVRRSLGGDLRDSEGRPLVQGAADRGRVQRGRGQRLHVAQPTEGEGGVGGALEAKMRRTGEQAVQERLGARGDRHAWLEDRQRRPHLERQGGQGRGARERHSAREQEPGEAAQGVQIGPRAEVAVAAVALLRRHQLGRARQRGGLVKTAPVPAGRAGEAIPVRQDGRQGVGDAEVGQLGHAVRREQHVPRFEVAVNDAVGVGVGQGVEQAEHQVPRAPPGLGGRQPVKGSTGHQLHDQIRAALDEAAFTGGGRLGIEVAEVVDLDDARVGEAGHGAGLGPEQLAKAGLPGRGGRQHLDRHRYVLAQVDPLPDFTHAPPRQRRVQGERPERDHR